FEGVVPLPDSSGPSEVVQRGRVDAGLGEPFGEVPVERVQPANIRKDDHSGRARRGGGRGKRREPVAVRGLQDVLAPSCDPGSAGNGWVGWPGVGFVTHVRRLLPGGSHRGTPIVAPGMTSSTGGPG